LLCCITDVWVLLLLAILTLFVSAYRMMITVSCRLCSISASLCSSQLTSLPQVSHSHGLPSFSSSIGPQQRMVPPHLQSVMSVSPIWIIEFYMVALYCNFDSFEKIHYYFTHFIYTSLSYLIFTLLIEQYHYHGY